MNGKPNPAVAVTLPKLEELELGGKKMLVVGGTAGIGRAIALLAAAKGATVTVVGRKFQVRVFAPAAMRRAGGAPRCTPAE
jgi:NAD(P)-dependent dehydrogenase (short-subunit alcohol dehydrogenase family)